MVISPVFLYSEQNRQLQAFFFQDLEIGYIADSAVLELAKEVKQMKKAAVLVAPGFEEGETFTIADILRRAHIECDLTGLTDIVTGAHQITVKCDCMLNSKTADAYDMVVLPGGRPGADNLRDSDLVMQTLKKMNASGKWIAAICAAPIALERAGILENRNFTAYPGYQHVIKTGNFQEDIVVVDQNLITSRGPATAYAFAYALVDVLGGDSAAVKRRMLYTHAFDVDEEKNDG